MCVRDGLSMNEPLELLPGKSSKHLDEKFKSVTRFCHPLRGGGEEDRGLLCVMTVDPGGPREEQRTIQGEGEGDEENQSYVGNSTTSNFWNDLKVVILFSIIQGSFFVAQATGSKTDDSIVLSPVSIVFFSPQMPKVPKSTSGSFCFCCPSEFRMFIATSTTRLYPSQN